MTDQKLVDELEKALTDEAYDGGMGAMSPEEFRELVRTLAVTAGRVVDEMYASTDNEKLIERVRAVIDTAVTDAYTAASQMNATASDHAATERDVSEAEAVRDLVVEALEAAEKAHTPTDDEREALANLVQLGFVTDWYEAADRVLAAGFRRSEGPRDHQDDPHDDELTRERDHHGIDPEPQGEPSDSQEQQFDPILIHLAAHKGGKTQALIDSMLAQANERGIRVEVVQPQIKQSEVQRLIASTREHAKDHGWYPSRQECIDLADALERAAAATEQGENQ